jgi:hypothetical protein
MPVMRAAFAVNSACGIVTCTLYISRAWTTRLANSLRRYSQASNAVVAGVMAAACAPLGGVGAAVCGAAGALYGGYALDELLFAAIPPVYCFTITYTRITPVPTRIGSNNGRNCSNS